MPFPLEQVSRSFRCSRETVWPVCERVLLSFLLPPLSRGWENGCKIPLLSPRRLLICQQGFRKRLCAALQLALCQPIPPEARAASRRSLLLSTLRPHYRATYFFLVRRRRG